MITVLLLDDEVYSYRGPGPNDWLAGVASAATSRVQSLKDEAVSFILPSVYACALIVWSQDDVDDDL